MKKIILAFLLTFAASAIAAESDWEVFTYNDGKSLLRFKADIKINIDIASDASGPPKILSVKNHGRFKQLEIIEYSAGDHGTSQIVRTTRAVVFNTRTKKILGDFPVRAEALGSKVQPKQPRWTAKGRNIIEIFEPETENRYKIIVD